MFKDKIKWFLRSILDEEIKDLVENVFEKEISEIKQHIEGLSDKRMELLRSELTERQLLYKRFDVLREELFSDNEKFIDQVIDRIKRKQLNS